MALPHNKREEFKRRMEEMKKELAENDENKQSSDLSNSSSNHTDNSNSNENYSSEDDNNDIDHETENQSVERPETPEDEERRHMPQNESLSDTCMIDRIYDTFCSEQSNIPGSNLNSVYSSGIESLGNPICGFISPLSGLQNKCSSIVDPVPDGDDLCVDSDDSVSGSCKLYCAYFSCDSGAINSLSACEEFAGCISGTSGVDPMVANSGYSQVVSYCKDQTLGRAHNAILTDKLSEIDPTPPFVKGTLLDKYGKPLSYHRIIVRDAATGRYIKQIRTYKTGSFSTKINGYERVDLFSGGQVYRNISVDNEHNLFKKD